MGLTPRQKDDLDRYITGNYGEDQFDDRELLDIEDALDEEDYEDEWEDEEEMESPLDPETGLPFGMGKEDY